MPTFAARVHRLGEVTPTATRRDVSPIQIHASISAAHAVPPLGVLELDAEIMGVRTALQRRQGIFHRLLFMQYLRKYSEARSEIHGRFLPWQH